MDIFELRTRFPKTYQEVFNRGVRAERAKRLGADLIAHAKPDQIHPAVFSLGSGQTAPQAKSVRSGWVISPISSFAWKRFKKK
jgi:hypothetical protein